MTQCFYNRRVERSEFNKETHFTLFTYINYWGSRWKEALGNNGWKRLPKPFNTILKNITYRCRYKYINQRKCNSL
jgi:hypothetical protein